MRSSGLEQPFFHVPNHRSRPGIWGTTCAGYNTGFALSAGANVVMLLDYGYAPPQWLEEHAKHQRAGKKIILGPHEYRTLYGFKNLKQFTGPGVAGLISSIGIEGAISCIAEQKSRINEISCFEDSFVASDLILFPVEESDAKCKMSTQPWKDVNYFNTKNESFPTDAVLDVNGMDEHYDLGRGPGDPDLCLRLTRLDLSMWIVNEAIVHCLNPRGILPNMNILIPEDKRLDPPYQDRWYVQDGYRYYDDVKASGTHWANNPFVMRSLRDQIWDWRERSQDPKEVLPLSLVEDEDYYIPGANRA